MIKSLISIILVDQMRSSPSYGELFVILWPNIRYEAALVHPVLGGTVAVQLWKSKKLKQY